MSYNISPSLTSLSMTISKSIHVAAMALFCYFLRLSNIPLCVCVSVCIRLGEANLLFKQSHLSSHMPMREDSDV